MDLRDVCCVDFFGFPRNFAVVRLPELRGVLRPLTGVAVPARFPGFGAGPTGFARRSPDARLEALLRLTFVTSLPTISYRCNYLRAMFGLRI